MEQGMTWKQAHDHMRQCTSSNTFFRRSFVFPFEVEDWVLRRKTVHAVMKSNNIKMFQLLDFGAERLSHSNLAVHHDDPADHLTDFTALSPQERRDALDIKICDVVANLANVWHDPVDLDDPDDHDDSDDSDDPDDPGDPDHPGHPGDLDGLDDHDENPDEDDDPAPIEIESDVDEEFLAVNEGLPPREPLVRQAVVHGRALAAERARNDIDARDILRAA